MLYDVLLHVHSWMRWLLPIVAIGFLLSRRPQHAVSLVGLVQLQFAVGLVLALGFSPIVHAAWQAGLSTMVGEPTLLFYGLLHPLAMVAGIGILEAGRAKMKRSGDVRPMRRAVFAWFAVIALAIPWPGLPWGRPLARVPERAAIEPPAVFAQRCVACHGSDGRGAIPTARAFGDREWQGRVTDERIAAVIRDGGFAHGLSPLMPPNRDLSESELAELVQFIRAQESP